MSIADTDPIIIGPETLDGDDKLDKFKLDLQRDADVQDEQREKAKEDMRFLHVSGGMWEDWQDTTWNTNRARMELNLVSGFVNRFNGEWEENRVGVEYKPDDDKTTTDDADLLSSARRADFRDNGGRIATDTGVKETSTCGIGAWKLATDFEDEGDPENDNMRVSWRVINGSYDHVIWDSSAKTLTKKDARWCNYLVSYTRQAFEDNFPGFEPSNAYRPENFGALNTLKSRPAVFFVSTRYEVVKRKEFVFIYGNLETGEIERYTEDDHELVKDELRASIRAGTREFTRKRKIVRQVVLKTVFSGNDILEPTRRIAGKWIPIITSYGYRAHIDDVEWYRGLVRELKDAARLFNMQVSALAENASSSGQEIPIFDAKQMQNASIQKQWADRNNQAYLMVDSLKDGEGNIVQSGPIATLRPAQLDGNTAAILDIVPNFIQAQTGGAPQDTLDPDASGKAINALIKRANMVTNTVMSNIREAIAWDGEVYKEIAKEIYATSRLIKTVSIEGKDNMKRLFQSVLDDESGRLVEANTFKGKFAAYADTGPQYETQRELAVETLKGMMELVNGSRNPELIQKYTPVMFATMISNAPGVGIEVLTDFNRKELLKLGAVQPETPEEEKFLQQLQQQSQQPDAQTKLLEAAATQQEAEARSLDASSVQKTADAGKKGAETIKIMSDIGIDRDTLTLNRNKQFLEQQNTVIEQAQQGLG